MQTKLEMMRLALVKQRVTIDSLIEERDLLSKDYASKMQTLEQVSKTKEEEFRMKVAAMDREKVDSVSSMIDECDQREKAALDVSDGCQCRECQKLEKFKQKEEEREKQQMTTFQTKITCLEASYNDEKAKLEARIKELEASLNQYKLKEKLSEKDVCETRAVT